MPERVFGEKDLKLLKQVITSKKLSSLAGGKFLSKFEERFAKLIGTKYAVGMNSGMSALHSAIISAGVNAGDEVICDPVFIFGPMAVLYNNAIPTFVDINPVTYHMDPDKIEEAISERTKAIIVTHAWGLPAEIDRIVEIGHRHNLLVIEDCAHAILATYESRKVGSWGDVGCFSFQASKQLSLGDGGMATASNEELKEKLGLHGGAPTFQSVGYGLHYNYRMNELTAAVGLAQLEYLPKYIEGLKTNARYLDEAVSGCKWLRLQRGPNRATNTFHFWVATFEGEKYGISLDQFKKIIKQANFSSISLGYTGMPSYQHPVIKDRLAHAFYCQSYKGDRDHYPPGLCPIAERIIPRMLLCYTEIPEETAKQDTEKLHKLINNLKNRNFE